MGAGTGGGTWDLSGALSSLGSSISSGWNDLTSNLDFGDFFGDMSSGSMENLEVGASDALATGGIGTSDSNLDWDGALGKFGTDTVSSFDKQLADLDNIFGDMSSGSMENLEVGANSLANTDGIDLGGALGKPSIDTASSWDKVTLKSDDNSDGFLKKLGDFVLGDGKSGDGKNGVSGAKNLFDIGNSAYQTYSSFQNSKESARQFDSTLEYLQAKADEESEANKINIARSKQQGDSKGGGWKQYYD